MADPEPERAGAPAEADAPETPAPEAAAGEAVPDAAADTTGRGKLFIVLCAAVAMVAGGAGYAVAVLTLGPPDLSPARAEAEETTGAPEAPAPAEAAPQAEPDEEVEKFAYKDLEPITVNLDEPRLARYVHASITLGIPEEEYTAAAPLIDARTRVLRDWLTVYLASLSLDDVRGAANLNRIRREILDAFNQELWPDAKPKIRKVLFKEFAVK